MPVSVSDTGNKAAYLDRAETLKAISEWGFKGRISLDDGDRGGSGKLQWDVEPGKTELDFYGALGRGAWHLQIGPDGAILKEANGAEQTAPEVDLLIQDRMGWPIPVGALQWWVRGLAAPGVIDDERLNSEGLPVSLDQFGWHIEFTRYDSNDGVGLPTRLNARLGDYRVKLLISRWRMDFNHAPSN